MKYACHWITNSGLFSSQDFKNSIFVIIIDNHKTAQLARINKKKNNIGNYEDIITQLWQGNEYTTTKNKHINIQKTDNKNDREVW